MMIPNFKIGQLVKIRAGLRDEDVPPDRRVGLIVRECVDPTEEGLWFVSINGKTLQFNENWMQPYLEDG